MCIIRPYTYFNNRYHMHENINHNVKSLSGDPDNHTYMYTSSALGNNFYNTKYTIVIVATMFMLIKRKI